MSYELREEIDEAIASIELQQEDEKQAKENKESNNRELDKPTQNNEEGQTEDPKPKGVEDELVDPNLPRQDDALVDSELQQEQHDQEAKAASDLRDEIDELFGQSIEATTEEPEDLGDKNNNKRAREEEKHEEPSEKRQKLDEEEIQVPVLADKEESSKDTQPADKEQGTEQEPEKVPDESNQVEESSEKPQEGATEEPQDQSQPGEAAEQQPEKDAETEPTTASDKQPESEPQQSAAINEKEDLEMIASELETATESNKEKRSGEAETATEEQPEQEKANGDSHPKQDAQQEEEDIDYSAGIPSNSELLNTNTAYAAYTTLSSQLEQHSQASAMLSSATLGALPLSIIAPVYLPPRIQLLINTLPTLDNLATQLLRTVASSPYQKIIDLASSPDTPEGATYRDLTSLFEFTKRLYSEEDPFLTVEHLAPGMWKEGDETPNIFKSKQQSIESTLRKVNLATFLAATLGTMEIGFFYLNESFLDVFCPLNNLDPANALSSLGTFQNGFQSTENAIGAKIGKLLKTQAGLFLDLKTQAYISAIDAGERSKEEILEDILPDNINEYLMSRRDVRILTPTENDFVTRCRQRKELLLNYNSEIHLSEEFEWFTFLRDLFDYVSRNMGYLIWGRMGKTVRDRRDNTPHTQELLARATAATRDASASAAGSAATSGATPTRPSSSTVAAASGIDTEKMLVSEMRESLIPIGSRPSPRRPWTREEEKALRHALELKGPHWATILELFGQGGKISEALKGRTQVQLKDKARNWKRFFLRSGLEVPSYLQGVTGGVDDAKNRRAKKNAKTSAAPIPTVNKGKAKAAEKEKASDKDDSKPEDKEPEKANDKDVEKETGKDTEKDKEVEKAKETEEPVEQDK
ncbi:Transcription factor TBF1 [Candida viswanathii]|uniref:Transcription factor TBF1 n=1 Tax=Candida viswanathii TaxID=5486 RepID=A0A367YS98_9ASCO|nr:Transcription factor TBF1 [Candida viswanathii]